MKPTDCLQEDYWEVNNIKLKSRLILGTGKFSSPAIMQESIMSSGAEIVTVALKRVEVKKQKQTQDILDFIPENVRLLPNTSGARNAKEAVMAAQLAAEALETSWVKLEIHPDPRYLLPDPVETLKATEELAKKGFIVFPYVHADPVLCKLLEEAGSSVVMPLAAPIGTNKGIRVKDFIEIIIEQSNVPVIIDAGLGRPSHAAQAMEMGADAVLVNTAIAVAGNPVEMAKAFKEGVCAGRRSFLSGQPVERKQAESSSPFTEFLNELDR